MMQTRFKFTNTNLKAIAANDINSRSTELELSDSELSGNKRFLLLILQRHVKSSESINGCWQMALILTAE